MAQFNGQLAKYVFKQWGTWRGFLVRQAG
eukprot:SAG11_NODE_7444_length_1143_cov_1.169540_2_plen_28_part_01